MVTTLITLLIIVVLVAAIAYVIRPLLPAQFQLPFSLIVGVILILIVLHYLGLF